MTQFMLFSQKNEFTLDFSDFYEYQKDINFKA